MLPSSTPLSKLELSLSQVVVRLSYAGLMFLHVASYHAGRYRTVVGCIYSGMYVHGHCILTPHPTPRIAIVRWAVEPGCETHVFVDLRHKTNVTRALSISRYVYWGAALLLSV